jgi:hypothetical protein
MAASLRRCASRCTSTRTPRWTECRSARRSSRGTGESGVLAQMRTRGLSKRDGWHPGPSKQQWAGAAPHRCSRPAAVVRPAGAGRLLCHVCDHALAVDPVAARGAKRSPRRGDRFRRDAAARVVASPPGLQHLPDVVECGRGADVAAGRLRWRVTLAILRSSTPAAAAAVAYPARSEWPESSSGGTPAG